jgi:hypothetical protein
MILSALAGGGPEVVQDNAAEACRKENALAGLLLRE